MKNKVLFFLFLFLSSFFCFNNSKAVVTDTIGILPAYPNPDVKFSDAWFIYNLDLGETKLDAVRIFNNKKETSVVKIFALDGITTSDGAFSLADSNIPQKEMGSWIKLAATEIELSPESEKIIPFIVNIPKDADVGDHMGGIAMQELESLEGDLPGTGFRFITRVGVRIYETIPGEVKKDFEITRFEWKSGLNSEKRSLIKDILDINKKTFFILGIKNNGNVKIEPKISLTVKNTFGIKVADLSNQDVGMVFPRSENQDSAITWDGMPIFGRYKIQASVSVPDSNLPEKTSEIIIWAVPYRMIFIFVIIAVFFILGRLIKKYFGEALKEKMPIYKVNPGDTLGKLSEIFMVSWKKIASINEIQKPFEIRTGEKLFIPMNRKNKDLIEKMKAEGRIDKSLLERDESSGGKKKKRIIIIIIVLAIGVGAVMGIRWRNKRIIHEEIKIPEGSKTEEPKETSEKTKSGVYKKSSVSVVVSNSVGDQTSNSRLLNKMKFMGYNANIQAVPGSYSATTIEYKSGKEMQARMVGNDLEISGSIDLKENPNISSDVVVYNLAPKEEFLEIDLSQMIRSTRGD